MIRTVGVHERHGTGETGTLWHLGLPFSCVLRNVSVGGALLDVDCEPSLGAEVILETSTLGRQQAQVVDVEVALVVKLANVRRVDAAEPVL